MMFVLNNDGLFQRRDVTLEQVVTFVNQSYSKAQVLKCLGLGLGGANYRWLNMVIQRHTVDTSHFTGKGHLRDKRHNWTRKIPLELILIRGSTYQNTSALKQRLYNEGLLHEQCYKCEQGPNWFGEKLVLQLDHIDGDPSNNLIENLRILCPNCHSQTKTYSNKSRYSGPVRKLAKRIDLESIV